LASWYAVLAGEMDRKEAGRIVLEIQIAIRLQKVAVGLQRKITRTKRAASHRAQGDGDTRRLESRSHLLTNILAASCSSGSKREQEATFGRAYEKQEIQRVNLTFSRTRWLGRRPLFQTF
jgi:hypothetical protein